MTSDVSAIFYVDYFIDIKYGIFKIKKNLISYNKYSDTEQFIACEVIEMKEQ